MMIQPVIFCTIVLGVGSVAQRGPGRQGRRPGARLLPDHVDVRAGHRPGRRQHPPPGLRACTSTDDAASGRAAQAARRHGSTTDFLLGIIPDSLFSVADLRRGAADPAGRAARRASRCRRWAAPASRSCAASVTCSALVFRVLAMIMWVAPIGAFGAIAAVVGETGVDALKSLAVLMFGFYVTCALFVFVVLGTLLKLVTGVNIFALLQVPRPRVPADPVHLVLGVGAAAPDRQDGARRRRQGDRRRRRADRLLVQPRRHRDLPDDGVAVHRRGAGRPAVASASRSRCCCS